MRCCLTLALVVAAGTLWAPSFARAQGSAFLEDRAGTEGPGFKTGRFVLHPGVAVEGGYDSNVFLQDTNVENSFILRVTGYLDFGTLSPERQREGESGKPEPQKITFRGGLGGAYLHYFNGRVRDNASADAHFDFAYNPSRVFSLEIRDQFIRTVQPFSDPNTLEGETISYGRNTNNAAVDLVLRSRSQVLQGRVGYRNTLMLFDASIYQYANSVTHHVPVELSWDFFPSSAIVYQFEYSNQRFLNPDEIAVSPTELSDNNRVRNWIGYNGALSNTLSLTAMIGYAAGFYQELQDFDDVIARVEARWSPRATITLDGGYLRDVLPSFIGNFTVVNRLYANATFVALGALQIGLQGWVSFDKSGLALAPDGSFIGTQAQRQDIRARVAFWAEYRFASWISVFTQVGWLADFTDFEYLGLDPLIAPVGRYQKVDAWIGLRVFY